MHDTYLGPRYNGEPEDSTLPPGLFIAFFNGQESPQDFIEDDSMKGPVIGPLLSIHECYGTHVCLTMSKATAAEYRNHFDKGTDIGDSQQEDRAWLDVDIYDGYAFLAGVYYGERFVFANPGKGAGEVYCTISSNPVSQTTTFHRPKGGAAEARETQTNPDHPLYKPYHYGDSKTVEYVRSLLRQG